VRRALWLFLTRPRRAPWAKDGEPERARDQRGVALLLVLVMVALLTIVVATMQENAHVSLATGVNDRDDMQATYLARSAVNQARLLLALGPTINDALEGTPLGGIEIWQYADLLTEVFNSADAASGLGTMLGVDLGEIKGFGGFDGHFSVEIVDEDSRINVNLASRKQSQEALARQLASLLAPAVYDPLFEARDDNGDVHDRETVIASIIDYVDTDTTLYGFEMGSEDTYYELLPDPYQRKNAPLDSLQELHLVRGIGDDFWSTFIEPDPTDPHSRRITVWGDGRINVNQAPPEVIASVLCTMLREPPAGLCDPQDQTVMATLLASLLAVRELFGGASVWGTVDEFVQAVNAAAEGIPGFQLDANEAKQLLKTHSQTFSIYATAEVGRVVHRIHAVVVADRANAESGGQLVYWREE
jgi:general secretion pathway protein K